MAVSDKRIVIVGAGQAGGHAAMAARRAAPTAKILLLGEEAYPPYERPPLSKAVLAGAVGPKKTWLKPVKHYEGQSIDLRLSTRVVGIDRKARRVAIDGQPSEAYDALILAMGARPRRLSAVSAAPSNVFYLRTIDDAQALRSVMQLSPRVVVVGAGLIGLEVAASARAFGCAVTVVENIAYPMQRIMAAEVARLFVAMHGSHGIKFRFETTIASIEPRGAALMIETSSGPIESDIVVIGIGAVPNQELAAAADLIVDDGVVVDEFGRTNDPAISAAGDLTRHYNPVLGRSLRLESWQNAQNQAIAVGTNVGGGHKPHAEVPWFWSDQFDLNLQIVGYPTCWDEIVWRGEPSSRQATAFYLHGGRVVGANALNNPRDIRFARMLIERKSVVTASNLADPATKLADLSAAQASAA